MAPRRSTRSSSNNNKKGPSSRRKKQQENKEEEEPTDGDSSSLDGHYNLEQCLINVGVTRADLEACESLEEEFRVIKKSYFDKILVEHPDKGGDPELFRRTRTSFEVLRELKARNSNNSNLQSFLSHLDDNTDTYYDQVYHEYEQEGAVPSYEFYQEAAQEVTPGYKVELAKTARSQCIKCKPSSSRGKTTKPNKNGAHLMMMGPQDDAITDLVMAVGGSIASQGGIQGLTATTGGPRRKKARTDIVTTSSTASSTALITTTKTTTASAASYIPKNAVRIGSLDEYSGSYGRWCHLDCWRVPYRIWAGLQAPKNPQQVLLDLLHMDHILLTGMVRLPPDSQQLLVQHVMNPKHWARRTAASLPPPLLPPPADASAVALHVSDSGDKTASKSGGDDRKPPARKKRTNTKASVAAAEAKRVKDPPGAATKRVKDPPTAAAASSASAATASDAHPKESTALLARKPNAKATFVLPRPGVNGALINCLAGKTFVLSGVFPEVGGGVGLNLGKDRLKGMIQSFGGRVTSAVSGKTNFLVIGKEPGQSKVSKARELGLPMIDVGALVKQVYGTAQLEDAPQPAIHSFSAGYMGQSLLGYY